MNEDLEHALMLVQMHLKKVRNANTICEGKKYADKCHALVEDIFDKYL